MSKRTRMALTAAALTIGILAIQSVDVDNRYQAIGLCWQDWPMACRPGHLAKI